MMATTMESPRQAVVRDAAFGQRMEQAAEMHPHCPAKGGGRLQWVVDELKKKGFGATTEGVRMWFAGVQKPRGKKGEVLAEILQSDPAWLLMGLDPTITPRDRKVRNAMVDGAVNVVAGLIHMDGGHPAFPTENDARAQRERIDLYAVIRGASYALRVVLGDQDEDGVATFQVPVVPDENVIVIGVIRDGMNFSLYELTPEVITEYGTRHSGVTEVMVGAVELRKIEGFDQRL